MQARFDALVKPAPSQKRKSRHVGGLARMRMETMRKLIAMGIMRMKRAKSTTSYDDDDDDDGDHPILNL